mmetsp:Transcript_34713/g.78376  ORF Transcript_34713/g.78376 Transcript_34713/m.78376 type:complete len:240 (+) Transcript_34713:1042-1761(+)
MALIDLTSNCFPNCCTTSRCPYPPAIDTIACSFFLLPQKTFFPMSSWHSATQLVFPAWQTTAEELLLTCTLSMTHPPDPACCFHRTLSKSRYRTAVPVDRIFTTSPCFRSSPALNCTTSRIALPSSSTSSPPCKGPVWLRLPGGSSCEPPALEEDPLCFLQITDVPPCSSITRTPPWGQSSLGATSSHLRGVAKQASTWLLLSCSSASKEPWELRACRIFPVVQVAGDFLETERDGDSA